MDWKGRNKEEISGSKHSMVVKAKACGTITMRGRFSRAQPRSGELQTGNLKVTSVENTGLKSSPFKAWGMSVYSHAC